MITNISLKIIKYIKKCINIIYNLCNSKTQDPVYKIYISSTSECKLKIIRSVFNGNNGEKIYGISCKNGISKQPFGETELKSCAFNRHSELKHILQNTNENYTNTILITIENGINETETSFIDSSFIIMEIKSMNNINIYYSIITCTVVPKEDIKFYSKDIAVYKTIGEYLHDQDPNVDPKNWSIKYNKHTREELIANEISTIFNINLKKKLNYSR